MTEHESTRIAVVTGASSGVGKAAAKALAAAKLWDESEKLVAAY